ncbi:hypothetical protein PTKIN_Ptkin13bG0203000 [Pterospermum kingtungense]
MLGSSSSKGGGNNNYDYSFKILLIGDSGVGKSSLLVTFISNFVHDLSPTIGVDFKIKMVTVGGKRLKLTIWDTAGQERFGTLTTSYYRGAHGIILVYDVTRRETFTNLSEIWAKEVELYSTYPECIKILVGNKVDKDSERAVTREEGMALAQEHKCSFLECSAKTRENVRQCFKDLILKKASGGYGPIRVNDRNDKTVPFLEPEAEFDLLIGDRYAGDYKFFRTLLGTEVIAYDIIIPDAILMNGKGPYVDSTSTTYESFTVEKGMQRGKKREKSPFACAPDVKGLTLDSLDVHVGQSYSVLVTADQTDADFYIVASPKLLDTSIVGAGILHYSNSITPASGPLPTAPDAFDLDFLVNQAKSIRWNLTAGAARPKPLGTFNAANVTLSQTFILQSARAEINSSSRVVVNNVSYYTPNTPLKLADYLTNGSGVYTPDQFPIQSVNAEAAYGISVVSGTYGGWIELVFKNNMDNMDSWHFDGFSFFVVGFGNGDWTPDSRNTYNVIDPIVRSTTQVYPGGWTAVYAFLENPGMWNLRSQNLKNWYLGQELYVRVYDAADPNPAKDQPPPENLLLCGMFDPSNAPAPAPGPWTVNRMVIGKPDRITTCV